MPRSVSKQWSKREEDIVIEMTERRNAGEKIDGMHNTPWNAHWYQASERLKSEGYYKSSGECELFYLKATGKRVKDGSKAVVDYSGDNEASNRKRWQEFELKILVYTISAEEKSKKDITDSEFWDCISALLAERGIMRYGNACRLQWCKHPSGILTHYCFFQKSASIVANSYSYRQVERFYKNRSPAE